MTATACAAADVGGPRSGHRRRHVLALAVLTTLAAALYTACSVNRFVMYRSGTYDLVIFDQAVRSYSHLRLPVAIVKGVHNGFGPDFAVLGDHFSPILALLAPLYRIHDGPVTLLVAQAVLFAAAVAPLWTTVRRELGTPSAYLVACAYVLAWPLAGAADFDFHEVAFAPLILAVLVERLSAYRHGRARWWHVALACLALLTVKEDMGLLVAGFGGCLAAGAGRVPGGPPGAPAGSRRLGVSLVVTGLAAAAVTTRLVIPAFGGRADYYWTYSKLGPTVPAAVWHALTHPIATAGVLVHPAVKVETVLWLLGVAAPAALASPYLVVVALPLAERLLSDAPNYWGTGAHYNAYLVVPLLYAGVDGVTRVRARLAGGPGAGGPRGVVAGRSGELAGPAWAAATLAFALVTVPVFAFGRLAEPASWQGSTDARAAAAVAAQVPGGVLVEAVSPVGPHLTGRTRVLLWDRTPRWAPWVVADERRLSFPFCDVGQQRRRVGLLEGSGYRVVYRRDGYLVLRRPDAVPQLTAPAAPPCS